MPAPLINIIIALFLVCLAHEADPMLGWFAAILVLIVALREFLLDMIRAWKSCGCQCKCCCREDEEEEEEDDDEDDDQDDDDGDSEGSDPDSDPDTVIERAVN